MVLWTFYGDELNENILPMLLRLDQKKQWCVKALVNKYIQPGHLVFDRFAVSY